MLWQRVEAWILNLIFAILAIHMTTIAGIDASLRAIKGDVVSTSNISPYLLRPVRKLNDAIADAKQERLEAIRGPVAEAGQIEATPPAGRSDE